MSPPTVRPAVPEDAAAIVALIRRLAAFEEPGAAVALTEETVRRDGFGPERRVEALLAEDGGGAVVGLVTVLATYSSWAGAPALVVHDLFVADDARARGTGRALLAAVARLAVARGCCRIDVAVVARNHAARGFYETLGFAPLADWLPYRLTGEALERLAAPPPIPGRDGPG